MKVSFDCPDKINGLLTVTIEEDDYKNDVEKELKDYRVSVRVWFLWASFAVSMATL